ncbi:DUF5348 domain-containing protein [Tuberibacillus calidus]|uniref:DUF5348 domain-containing protein n=1 Tax=Tuberibacillus calidus TaxID=340097 RepID=UPI000485B201|nr:DUF5348 domain-containing protein [Tuberibacillus calidus]
MTKQWRDMVYDKFLDCWMVVLDGGNRDYRIRCGETFKIHLGDGNEILCRMELGFDWYIIVGINDTRFYLNPNETYQVKI